jgi:hypothetical protein
LYIEDTIVDGPIPNFYCACFAPVKHMFIHILGDRPGCGEVGVRKMGGGRQQKKKKHQVFFGIIQLSPFGFRFSAY